MLPQLLPLFPLPNVVLFPGVFLPLHIFEPRYRQMVADALDGDRVIGIVLLRPGWERTYEGRPAVYETGCAGVITHAERLDDGRYNIVLKGLEKFRVVAEDASQAYRVAGVAPLEDGTAAHEREPLRDRRQQLELTLSPMLERAKRRLPPDVADDEVVNALSQYLDLEPVERQALLECEGPLARCRLLIDLVQMRSLPLSPPSGATPLH